MLAENVEKQKASTIEEASAIAREKLEREVSAIVRTSLHSLLTNTLVKIILIAVLFILYEIGWITSSSFAIAAGVFLGLFMIRDIIRGWPVTVNIFNQLRTHGWHPKEALAHYVSASVFDQALNEVSEATAKPKTKMLLQLAGTSQREVSIEIAAAVANIAHETSFEQIRPRIIMAAIRAVTIISLYSAIVFLIFRLV